MTRPGVAHFLWSGEIGGAERAVYQLVAEEVRRGDHDVAIVFGQSVTQAEMQSLLEQIGAKIEAGPSGVGRYRVRLERPITSHAELDALAAELGKDSRVRFAARALTEEAGP